MDSLQRRILGLLFLIPLFAIPLYSQSEDAPSPEPLEDETAGDLSLPESPFSGSLRTSLKAIGLAQKEGKSSDPANTGVARVSMRAEGDYKETLFTFVHARMSGYSSERMGEESFESEWGENHTIEACDPSSRAVDKKNSRVVLDIREAWIKYENSKLTLKGGRQRINWGEGRFFDPLNVVAPMDSFSLEPDELAGTDSLHGIYWITGDARVETVLSFNRRNNLMRSDFERSRTIRIPSFLSTPESPRAWMEYREEKIFKFSEREEFLIRHSPEGDHRDNGNPRAMYQDGALRLHGPLNDRMDGSLVAGWKGRRSFAGADWTGTFLEAAFRAGGIYFSPLDLDREAVNYIDMPLGRFDEENRGYGQFYTGMDYSFSRYLTVQIQYFYNGGALIYRPDTAYYIANLKDITEDREAFDILRNGITTYQPHFLNISFSGDVTDLLRYDTYIFGDLNGRAAMGIFQLTLQATDNLALSAGIRAATKGAPTSDFTEMEDGFYVIAEYSLFSL